MTDAELLARIKPMVPERGIETDQQKAAQWEAIYRLLHDREPPGQPAKLFRPPAHQNQPT